MEIIMDTEEIKKYDERRKEAKEWHNGGGTLV